MTEKYRRLAQFALQEDSVTEILRSFDMHQVPVIALKGLALLGRVYPQPGQRSMYDVDLLLHQTDLVRAEQILQSLGYVFSDEGLGLSLPFQREYMGEMVYREGAMVVELHQQLVAMSWFRATTAFDLDALWSRAVPTEIAGAPALRLCLEDELIHLCYHTAIHHGLAHPYGVRDILGVARIEHDTLDWPTLAERARAWRVSVAVWAALSVARGRMQESRIKNQESRIEKLTTSNENHVSRITHHEVELIPESALAALRVPRWRQWLLRPFVQRAMTGQAALVSGTMRFLGVLLVDRVRDLPGVVLRGLFPGRRWLQLRYNLSPRQAFWRQFAYPLEVLSHGAGALLHAVIRHS
ncbi:MAG: nucleotidyltransferase family protein [Anaerolineae bacterium]|nr:nucleotidyltransferase family protein [Anaerolineae bacterium]